MYTPAVRRTQFYLNEDLDARLRAAAAHEGRSAASIVRDAVERYLSGESPAQQTEDPLLALIGAFSGGHPDGAENHDHYLYLREE